MQSNLLRLELFYESGVYKLRPNIMKDNFATLVGDKYSISNDWHVIEVEWKKASAPNANDGYLTLWVDDVMLGTIANVDNDLWTLDQVQVGAVASVDATTSGSMLFDNFVSRRFSYIGPVSAPSTSTPTPTETLIPDTSTPEPSLTPTLIPDTLTPDTFTPTPTPLAFLPSLPKVHADYLPYQQTLQTLTINYEYDALRRLTSADYSDGRNFSYTYDVNGNTLSYSDPLSVTSYQYDSANQLLTAQNNESTWYYTYDANGSLIEVLPNNTQTNGAKRYTYNSAGYLTQVEAHNGTTYTTQAQMTYNGLGQRISMDASGVIAYYVMDNNRSLTATTGTDTTSYLYGLGVIGEESTAWSYSLSDGTNTQRQLTDSTGEITYSARYTPWGDTLETHGTGNFTFGYFGGLMDEATGLMYVGEGQYYDSSTGRFLTRGVNPNGTNPYLPFDPTGAIIGPMGILAVLLGRKKKKSKYDVLLLVLVFAVASGVAISACGSGGGTPSPTPTDPTQTPTVPPSTTTPSPSPSTTSTPAPDFVPDSPNNTPCGCNVWNYSEWETIDDLSQKFWLIALQTYSHYCNADPSEDNVFWPEENKLSLRLILAHNIIKEFGDMLLYDWGILEEQSEAYGRQYWEHCGPYGCFIKDGIADSRLISFLSGSESWRVSAGGIDDVITGGFGPRKRKESLKLADRIINPSGSDTDWKSGQLQNKPYHYGYISGSHPPSPEWLVQFLKKGSNQGYDDHQYVESYLDPNTKNLLFVLTPNQSKELCGNTICVQLLYGAPPPDWLNK